MGENEQTLMENRNIPITDEVREPVKKYLADFVR